MFALPVRASTHLIALGALLAATSCDNGGGGASDDEPNAGDPVPTCGDSDAEALGACADQARIQQDVETIALARPSGSAHWQVVQDLCAVRLESYGFEVERQDYGGGSTFSVASPGAIRPEAVSFFRRITIQSPIATEPTTMRAESRAFWRRRACFRKRGTQPIL